MQKWISGGRDALINFSVIFFTAYKPFKDTTGRPLFISYHQRHVSFCVLKVKRRGKRIQPDSWVLKCTQHSRCWIKGYLHWQNHLHSIGKKLILRFSPSFASKQMQASPAAAQSQVQNIRHESAVVNSGPDLNSQSKGSFRINTSYGPLAALFATSYWGRQMHTAVVTLPSPHFLMRQYLSTLNKQQKPLVHNSLK